MKYKTLTRQNWYFIFQKMVSYIFLYPENSNYPEQHHLAEISLHIFLADKLQKRKTLNTNPIYVIDRL